MNKRYSRDGTDFVSLATGFGSCFASDRITVDGLPVGYMYRETPDSVLDSGWRFLAGDESDDYVNTPDNMGMFDINAIANYDRSIVIHLEAPFGTAMHWVGGGFVLIDGFSPSED